MAPAGAEPEARTTDACLLDEDTVARYERAVATAPDGDGRASRPAGGPVNPFVLSRLLGPVFRTLIAESGFRVPDAVLHAEQVIEVDRPLRVGQSVRAVVEPPEAFPYGLGTTAVAVRARVVDEGGEQVATVAPVIAAQGDCGIPVSEGRPPGGERAARGELVATWTRVFGAADLARYADAADDHNVIHVDRQAAVALGFPGLVVHGMCTLATGVSEAARRVAGSPGDLVRVATRFSRPLVEGQEVVYELYATDHEHRFVLQARHGGHAVLKGCTLEVRPPLQESPEKLAE